MTLILKRLGVWLFVRPRSTWIAVAFTVIVTAWAALPSPSESEFRIAGAALQVAGLILILREIDGTQRLFGQPTAVSAIMRWLRDFSSIFEGPRSVTAHVSPGVLTMTGGSASARVIHQNPTLEQRLEDLEREFAQHREVIDKRLQELVTRANEHESRLEQEAREREAAHAATMGKLTDYATRDSHLAILGALMLMIGVIYGTVAPEIVRLLPS